jgi:hypothetical protein
MGVPGGVPGVPDGVPDGVPGVPGAVPGVPVPGVPVARFLASRGSEARSIVASLVDVEHKNGRSHA